MPLYELFCLARPQLARAQQADLFRSAAKTVLAGGGVLTDIKNFGERELAYKVRRAGGIFTEALTWQVSFAANPAVVAQLESQVKIDERIIRHLVVKKQVFKDMPTTFSVKRRAANLLSHKKGQTKPSVEVLDW